MLAKIEKIVYPDVIAKDVLEDIFTGKKSINPAGDIFYNSLTPQSKVEFLKELRKCSDEIIDAEIDIQSK